MGPAIGNILPLTIGVAISVLLIAAIILALNHAQGARQRGRIRGWLGDAVPTRLFSAPRRSAGSS